MFFSNFYYIWMSWYTHPIVNFHNFRWIQLILISMYPSIIYKCAYWYSYLYRYFKHVCNQINYSNKQNIYLWKKNIYSNKLFDIFVQEMHASHFSKLSSYGWQGRSLTSIIRLVSKRMHWFVKFLFISFLVSLPHNSLW